MTNTLIKSVIELSKKNPISAGFLVFLMVCPLLGTSVITLILQSGEVAVLRQASPLTIMSIYVMGSVLMAFGIVPTTVIAIASGFIWGWQAVPYMIFAYGLAQWLGYKAAKWVGGDALLSNILALEYYQSQVLVLNAIKNQWILVFFCRLSPVLPFGIMNYVLSVMQIQLKPFLMAGLLGMLPRTLFFIWIGIESKALLDMPVSGWFEKGIWVLISAVSIFMIMKILTRSFKNAITVSEETPAS